jgi:hypothetical protein
LYERYADSAAAIPHLLKFKEQFAARFSRMVERRRFIVIDHPTDDLKALLDPYGAVYFVSFGNFAY